MLNKLMQRERNLKKTFRLTENFKISFLICHDFVMWPKLKIDVYFTVSEMFNGIRIMEFAK